MPCEKNIVQVAQVNTPLLWKKVARIKCRTRLNKKKVLLIYCRAKAVFINYDCLVFPILSCNQ